MEDDRFETNAKKFLEEFLKNAKTTLSYDKMPPAEREDLELGQRNLAHGFGELTTILNEIRKDGRDSVAEHGFAHLSWIMSGAFLIGSRGTITDGLRQYVHSEKGSTGGKARRPKIEAKHAEVRRIGEKIRSINPSLTPQSLATKIKAKLPVGMELSIRQIQNIMSTTKSR